jgi:hypothetical protein
VQETETLWRKRLLKINGSASHPACHLKQGLFGREFAQCPPDSWPNAKGLACCPSRRAGQETCVECLPGGAGNAER